jgi:hyperosmotically inducible protein
VKTHKRRIFPAAALGAALLFAPACNREEPPVQSTASPSPAPAQQSAGVQTSDEGIATSVQARYYNDDAVRGRNVSVAAENGVVTLRGTVESQAARDRAVALAREVQGVRDVRDELSVQTASAGGETRPGTPAGRETEGTTGRAENSIEPAWITTKIQAQYFVNPEVKPWNVDVTTGANGVVTLEGEVEQAADRDEAARIARETEGVSRVDNRLRVKGEPAAGGEGTGAAATRPDVWLTAKVQSKYFLDDLVKLRNIDVSTQNGVVTLSGAVASDAERRQAVSLARTTEGVRQVTDNLKVDPNAVVSSNDPATAVPLAPVSGLKRPDAWITMKVQSQYFLDPEIKGHEIDVDTTRGVVSLKGLVANQELKQQAERIARETEGVTRVINGLTVGAAGGEPKR